MQKRWVQSMTWQLDSAIAPIQLEHCFFTDVHFEAFPETGEGTSTVPPIRKPVTRVSQLDEKGRRWSVFLLVESEKAAEGKTHCFSFRLNVCGIFNWVGEDPSGEDPDFVEKAIAVSGAGVLFGSCREFLRTIVSKGPYPEYRLPTVRFVPVDRKIQESEKS